MLYVCMYALVVAVAGGQPAPGVRADPPALVLPEPADGRDVRPPAYLHVR